MKNISLKYRIVLVILYVIPFFGFLFFFLTSILSIYLVYKIPEFIAPFSGRPKVIISVFLSANLIAHFQIIRGYFIIKSQNKLENFTLLEDSPSLFKNIIFNLKKELGVDKQILISRNMDEFFIYNYKRKLVIGIPYLSLMVLEKQHLQAILKHELLHYKRWDTLFDIWFEKSFFLLKKMRTYLEIRSLSSINPVYWILRVLIFIQKKGYEIRKELAELAIDTVISNDKKNVYESALSKTFLAEKLADEIKALEIFEKSTICSLMQRSLENNKVFFENCYINEDRFINLKIDTDINWDKVCLADTEMEIFYEQYEMLFLSNILQEQEFKEVKANDKSNIDNKGAIDRQKEEMHIVLHRLNYVFQKVKWENINLIPFEFDRKLGWISSSFPTVHGKVTVLEISVNTNEFWKITNEIYRIGKESCQRTFKHVSCYLFIVMDSLDDVPLNEILKNTQKYYPSSILRFLSFLTGFFPIGFKCGGVIPIFISKDKQEFYYKLPLWAGFKRLTLLGFKTLWEESLDLEYIEEKSCTALETKSKPKGKWWLSSRGAVLLLFFILLWSIILYNDNEASYSLKLFVFGIIFSALGFVMFVLHFPLVWNDLIFIMTFGQQSQKFNSLKEKEEFIKRKGNMIMASKYVCYLLIVIGSFLIFIS